MTQRTLMRIALVAAMAHATLSGTSLAQAVGGTLLGNVTDTQGAAIPGGTVTAVETQTNVSRSVVTNQSGNYVFANMKDGLYRVEPASGLSRVMCYSPRHDLALCRLPLPEIEALIEAWRGEYEMLGARPEVAHVLIAV